MAKSKASNLLDKIKIGKYFEYFLFSIYFLFIGLMTSFFSFIDDSILMVVLILAYLFSSITLSLLWHISKKDLIEHKNYLFFIMCNFLFEIFFLIFLKYYILKWFYVLMIILCFLVLTSIIFAYIDYKKNKYNCKNIIMFYLKKISFVVLTILFNSAIFLFLSMLYVLSIFA